MVAARQERDARRRTERRRVELVVAETARGQTVQGRRLDAATEGAGRAEADVVDQDDYDIGRAFGRFDGEARRGRRIARVDLRDLLVGRRLDRQHRAIELAGGRRRTEGPDHGCSPHQTGRLYSRHAPRPPSRMRDGE